jgi:hypothetical protein
MADFSAPWTAYQGWKEGPDTSDTPDFVTVSSCNGAHTVVSGCCGIELARRIAATPELLEALKQIVALYGRRHVEAVGTVGFSAWEKAKAAIARAEGR